MIKNNRISTLLFLVLLLFIACQNNTNKKHTEKEVIKITDTYSVDGVDLELLQSGDKADIKITSKDRKVKGKLKISPPCYFLKRWGKVQSFAYSEVGVEHTLIVLGDTVGMDRKRYFGIVEDNKICGVAIQGILIKKDSVIITERVMDGGFACKDSGRDEKDYWDFAHTRETVKNARNPKYR
jgi:hypothetical protein